jgi:hypothetical protein
MAASKTYLGGPQATITLLSPADVYLVVDDRWAAAPVGLGWLAGWTDTNLSFTVYENNTRPALPFSVYKQAAPAGNVTVPAIGANNAFDYFIIVD